MITLSKYYLTLHEERFEYESDSPVNCSVDIAKLMISKGYHNSNVEHAEIVLLDNQGNVIGIEDLSVGTRDQSLVDIGEVFKIALYASASAIVVVHNHPSGNTTPSPQDMTLAKELKKAGRILNLGLADFIILSPKETWYSCLDQGDF